LRRIIPLVLLLILTGCTPDLPLPSTKEEEHLARMLTDMDASIDAREAHQLAHEAITYSYTLAKRYRVTTPPWIHNFLVNVHLRNRGLCYQWADDLYAHLTALHLTTLTLYPVGANIGRYLTEHNALVVLPPVQTAGTTNPDHRVPNPYDGILLDPWRHSGDLFFTPVGKDKKYHWTIRWTRLKKNPVAQ